MADPNGKPKMVECNVCRGKKTVRGVECHKCQGRGRIRNKEGEIKDFKKTRT